MGKDRDLFWKYLEPEYVRGMMFCRKLMGDRDEGDDLYQDALILAYTGFKDLKDKNAFRSWFYRILINKFRSTMRRPWWKRRLALTADVEMQLVGDDPVDRHAARRWLKRAFEAVSAEEQALITLYELEGWTVKELALLYRTTESSIKVRLFRTRKRMKEALIKFSRQVGVSEITPEAIKKEFPWNVAEPGIE